MGHEPAASGKERPGNTLGRHQPGTGKHSGYGSLPFRWEQKLMGKDDFSKIPNGHPAIEHRFELLYSEGVDKGRITLNKFVELACTNPAKIFGMFPQKGTIGIGSDADIVL